MIMSQKCYNNNSDNPLTSRRTDGGKKRWDGLFYMSVSYRTLWCEFIWP